MALAKSSLALLLCASLAPRAVRAAADQGAPADPLQGCTRTGVAGGLNASCGTAVASVVDTPGGDLKMLRDAQVALLSDSFRQQLKGDVSVTDIVYRDGEKGYPAALVKFVSAESKKVIFEGQIVLLRPEPGSARVVFCGGASGNKEVTERCAALIPLFANQGPAPFQPAVGTPRVLGKAFDVPAGCAASVANDQVLAVACGDTASLIVLTVPKDDLDRVLEAKRGKLVRSIPGIQTLPQAPCKVLGKEATCTVLRAGEGASATLFRMASATVGKGSLFVECDQDAALPTAHEVCKGMLEF